MKVIVWNMGAGYGFRRDRHDASWHYLERQDPDVALLQEAVPPDWAFGRWPGIVAAAKYPASRIPWGSAIVAKTGTLEAVLPTAETYWLNELWGGTVTARAVGLADILLTSIHSKAESRHPSEFPPEWMGGRQPMRSAEGLGDRACARRSRAVAGRAAVHRGRGPQQQPAL